jgi:hypothetical protein
LTPDEFATKARTYCLEVHASVTSWGRTAQHSNAVGGFTGDPHTRWLAIDVVYDDPTLPVETRRAAATVRGLQLIVEATHDHLQGAV